MGKKNFIQSAAILAMAGVLVRLIGALYRIPLVNIIGEYGIGLYSQIFPVYNLLLTLSTAGIPGAISKMVSERMVYNDRRNARRVFSVSLWVLTAIGFLSTLIMAAGSGFIASMMGKTIEGAQMLLPSVLAIAPALLLVAMITAFRGYFQGHQNMTPTAVSQVIEQLLKFFPGLMLVALMNAWGTQYGSSAAMWAITLSEGVALVYLVGVLAFSARKTGTLAAARPTESYGAIARQLGALALPMLVGALFLPLSSMLDTLIVKDRLMHLGVLEKTASTLIGLLTGVVGVLVNVPSVISLSLSTSLIPSIAESHERGDTAAVARKSRVGLKMTTLVSMPCAVGLAVLARPIIVLLFAHGNGLSQESITISAELMVISALSVIFLSIVQSTNGTLQGIGRVKVPMYSLAAGALVKVVLNYVLVGIPALNIHGAPIGTISLYGLSAAINLYFVRKYTGVRIAPVDLLGKPLLACAGMGAAAWAVYTGLQGLLGGNLATVAAIVVAVPVYLVLTVLFGAVGREELLFLPKGDRLAAALRRMHLLKS